MLHRLAELEQSRGCNREFDFPKLAAQLHNFCGSDLSAFYFDVRKDALYCDPVDSVRRRAARNPLDQLFNCLTAWLAPVPVFTAEEAWLTRFPHEASVMLGLFPDVPAVWRNISSVGAGNGSARFAAWSPGPWSSSGGKADWRQPAGGARPSTSTRTNRTLLAGMDAAELAITSDIVLATEPPPRRCVHPRPRRRRVRGARPGIGREVRALLAGPARGHGLGGEALPTLHRRRGCPACGVSRCALSPDRSWRCSS